jgi:hypothetical protein
VRLPLAPLRQRAMRRGGCERRIIASVEFPEARSLSNYLVIGNDYFTTEWGKWSEATLKLPSSGPPGPGVGRHPQHVRQP